MHLPEFEYVEPKSLKEAAKALASDPKGSVLLAGGTDLLVNMKHRLMEPRRLINLKSIPKMAYIESGKDGMRIGVLTTLHEVSSSPLIRDQYPALCQAAQEVGAYSHQVMGTVGGNLCQGNRCRYYNQSAFWRNARGICYKAGGEICHVVRKPGECHSTYCGDLAPVLIALEADVKVMGPEGERRFPLKKIFKQDGKKPLYFKKGEILKEILLPHPLGQSLYLKWRLRGSIEFPIVSLALHLNLEDNNRMEQGRIVFSGVGPGPVEAFETEKKLKGASLDADLIEEMSDQVAKEITPMRTSIYSPAYKRKIAGVLLRKSLLQMM